MTQHFPFRATRKDRPAVFRAQPARIFSAQIFSNRIKMAHSRRQELPLMSRLRKILLPTLALLVLSIIFFFVLLQMAHAGGPKYVAGVSYFDPATKGLPLTWTQGSVVYYTDQGDLSQILLGPAADAFVADAFSRWTLVQTAAISSTRGGYSGGLHECPAAEGVGHKGVGGRTEQNLA